jgi:hypothetical protein
MLLVMCSATVSRAHESGSSLTEQQPPAARRPGAVKSCGPSLFAPGSIRVSNELKACLDQVTFSLLQDPRTTLIIDGHRDALEAVGISLTRAIKARDYLVTGKRLDLARIMVRNFGDTCPRDVKDRRLNRRVELWVLPAGASTSDIDLFKQCAPGSTARLVAEEKSRVAEPRQVPGQRRLEKSSAPAEALNAGPEASRPRLAKVRPDVEFRSASSNADGHAGRATILKFVRIRMDSGGLTVWIDTDGEAEYRDFRLADPQRIVVDLVGLRIRYAKRTVPVGSRVVERVRIGKPESGIVRVVIDLRSVADYVIRREGSSVAVEIRNGSAPRK